MTIEQAEALHNKAMECVDRALSLRLAGKVAEAQQLLLIAFNHEQSAARAVAGMLDFEPTRSVLLRSAATLAIDLDDMAAAERLLYSGLAGDPPEGIRAELRELLEQVTFKRHLELRGIKLESDEVQMAIAGNAVGLGIAPTDEFISRVASTEKMLFRIAERRLGRPYREHGRTTPVLHRDLELFVSVPRAASFSVTLKIGRSPQLAFPGMDFGMAVVDQFLEELELFNRAEESKLKERISDDAYYRNFTALARTIAPDGHDITTVGFTAVREGKRRDVALLRTSKVTIVTSRTRKDPRTILVGRLRAADATRQGKNQIKLIPEHGGKAQTIVVPPGMMSDIVRPMWDEFVRVVAKRRRSGTLELIDIEKVRATTPAKPKPGLDGAPAR